jgi:hypothetical protein
VFLVVLVAAFVVETDAEKVVANAERLTTQFIRASDSKVRVSFCLFREFDGV